ncbi:hypothetical protein D918_02980 [Trichuris suis]|nr:hypothetical protein D918_02980 [Trichuris suis]
MNTALIFLAAAYFACLNAERSPCGVPEDNGLMVSFQTTTEKDRLPVSSTPWVVAVYVSEVRFGSPQVRLCSGYMVNGRKDIVLVADDCVQSDKKVKVAVEFVNRVNNTDLRINAKQLVKLGDVKKDVIGNVLVLKLEQKIPPEIAQYSICLPEIGTKFSPGECLLSRWVVEKGKPQAVYGKDANGISELYCIEFDKRYSPKTGICLKSTMEQLKNSLVCQLQAATLEVIRTTTNATSIYVQGSKTELDYHFFKRKVLILATFHP